MHKDIPVISMEVFPTIDGTKVRFRQIFGDGSHLPIGGQLNPERLKEWWESRAVPKTRTGVSVALRLLNYKSTGNFLIDNLALSLNDCYWIKPDNSFLQWSDVSLYRNNFIDIFGELTFNSKYNRDLVGKTYFRQATSQGELRKKWVISNDGRRILVKGNYGSSYQQSLNEIFATNIHEKQGIPIDWYTYYYLCKVSLENNREELGCFSYNFCNENVELVTAWDLIRSIKKPSNISYFGLFKQLCLGRCCFKEDYFDNFMSYMISTDYLITNTDRHLNNIGLLRNPDTLNWYAFAPIYDSGNSMFYKTGNLTLVNFDEILISSFLKKEKSMLKYINRSVINFSKLPTFDIFLDIYKKDPYMGEERLRNIWELYLKKVNILYDLNKER